MWSGPSDDRGLYGVALAIPKEFQSSIVSWKPISDRLLTARLNHRHGKFTVVVGYAPTDVAPENIKDRYYNQLH